MSSRDGVSMLFFLMGAGLAVGCGGQTLESPNATGGGGSTGSSPKPIGPIDLSQAPTTVTMDCDQGIGQLAFVNPCLIGENLAGSPTGIGYHETDCHLAGGGGGIAWVFMLPFGAVATSPDQPLTFPTGLPSPPPSGNRAEVESEEVGVSHVAGTMTFSRVDPKNRAFIGHLAGTITWAGPTENFSCSVDAPFWGAPGNFL